MNEIVHFYTALANEDARLRSGWGQLEFARTQELLLKRLPRAPCAILDIGGGAGLYSEWLGSLGYEMHLIDLAPAHVEHVLRHARHIRSAHAGDARDLPFADCSASAVLLMGPLYHLVESADRLQALREARRVLRAGGLLFAAAITRWAPLFAALTMGIFDDPAFEPVLTRDLADGQHRNTTGDPRRFTTAFFHRPEELAVEIETAGFRVQELLPIEGPAWLAGGSEAGFQQYWNDENRRAKLLDLVRSIEHDGALLACSPHMLAVASL